MLATLVREPFENPEWVYEVKWDGYRILAHISNKGVILRSREAQDYTNKYPQVAQQLKLIRDNAVIE